MALASQRIALWADLAVVGWFLSLVLCPLSFVLLADRNM